jgi:2-polyprenyl-3-methyl-5-hydroxy-6-metoxy-1,4-benzoquinol methylase
MKQWYEELFTNYANTYDNENFTKGTLQEVDFIESELNGNRSLKILDIGCGTGRHDIELAKRGYSVLGIDLSESQLEKAREKAKIAHVDVTFLQQDARNLAFNQEFDAVIMLCEGGFSLMETDEMNFAILQSAARALKPDGKYIFSCLNALFPLYHSVKDFLNSNAVESDCKENLFNLLTFRDINTFELSDDFGNKKTLQCNERYYAPSEITWMLKTLGFRTIDIFGCQIGNFSRNIPLTTDDFEILVVASL